MANSLDMSNNITAISGVACIANDRARSRPELSTHEFLNDEHGDGLLVLRLWAIRNRGKGAF